MLLQWMPPLIAISIIIPKNIATRNCSSSGAYDGTPTKLENMIKL